MRTKVVQKQKPSTQIHSKKKTVPVRRTTRSSLPTLSLPAKKIHKKPIVPPKKKLIVKKKQISASSGQKQKKPPQKQAKTKAIKKGPASKPKSEAPIIKLSEKQLKQQAKQIEKDKKNQKKVDEKKEKMVKQQIFQLIQNLNITEIDSNPLLDAPRLKSKGKKETRVFELKDCCVFCNNREILQCVKYGDVEGFKRCLKSTDSISNPFQDYSLACRQNIFNETIKSKNVEILKLILDYEDQKIGTGVASKFQFYFPIRQVQLSRGGKEGNNAFTHDVKMRKPTLIDKSKIFKYEPSLSIIKILQTQKNSFGGDDFIANLKVYLGKIARSGNFDLLKYVIKSAADNYGYGFNKLHTSSILQGGEVETLKTINKASLLKKAYDQCQLLPTHLAAVNPDTSIFKKYFKFYPTSQQVDIDQRDIVHYAAANVNPEAIEFLISKKVEINNRDQKGITPLMIACKLGRAGNVELIVKEQQRLLSSNEQEQDNDADLVHYQAFHKFVNTAGPFKQTPLHYAAQRGHLSIVKILVEEGEADMEAKNFYGNTPIGVAAEQGHLEVVQYLFEKGSNIHGVDKSQKSPLIRACINGQIHVVAYCLRVGVNPNFKDNSENSALHYACAYGWKNIVQFLIEEGGADPNVLNEWKTSAILVAMLKGHFGIVDYLINLRNLNASFMDDQGRTLIAQLCMNINEDSAKNLKYLLEKGKIDAKTKDAQGFTPLHHLAKNNPQDLAQEAVLNKEVKEDNTYFVMRKGKKIKKTRGRRGYQNTVDKEIVGYFSDEKDLAEYNKRVKDLEDCLLKCGALLLKEGLSVQEQTDEDTGGLTPLFISVMCHNYSFSKWLIEKDPTAIQGQIKQGGHNILHLLSHNFFYYDLNVLPLLVKGNKNLLKDLAYQKDDLGHSPFLSYFKEFASIPTTLLVKHYWRSISDNAKLFVQKSIMPRALQILIEVSQVYAVDLKYDVSSQVGMVLLQKKALEKIKKAELISEDVYRSIKSLQYLAEEQPDDKMQVDNKKPSYKYDDIKKFEPAKKSMGLLKPGYKTSKQTEQAVHHRGPNYYQRQMARKRMVVPGDDEGEIVANIFEKFYIDRDVLYQGENALCTALHILLKAFSQLKCRTDITLNDQDESQFLQLAKSLLKLSNAFIQRNDPPHQQGFNKFDMKNQNILFYAINYELKAFISEIASSGTINLAVQGPLTKISLIHLLCKVRNKEIIDTILGSSKKEELSIQDKNGNSPLHYAAHLRNDYCVEQLLKKGAKVNQVNKYGYNALHISLNAFDDSKDHTPKIERLLIQAGININHEDEDGRSPIFYLFFKHEAPDASSKKDPANIVMTLLKEPSIKLNFKDKNACTALHYACSVGATISALTLINSGCDVTSKNAWGNTPFGSAIQNNQSELCILLIQNGCRIEDNVNALKVIESSDKFAYLADSILPKKLHYQIKEDKRVYRDIGDYIKQNYKVTEESPFKLAIEHNQGGISHLLLSKQYDVFEAMIGCLKLQKFEMFMDLFEGERLDNIKKVDSKKRNLIFILLKSASSLSDESQIERSLEILTALQNYNLEIGASDSNGRNVLHVIGKAKNMKLFKQVYERLSAQEKKQLLNQKDKKKQATPLVYLIKLNDIEVDSFDLKVDLSNIDLTYIKREKKQLHNMVEIPPYLQDDNCFPVILNEGDHKTTLVHKLILKMKDRTDIKDLEIIKKMIKLGFDLNVVEPDTGRNILTTSVLLNNETALRVLLGYTYDAELDMYVKKEKPLVRINHQDRQGKTALHYALKPSDYGVWMNLPVLDILLDSKADPLLCDNSGFNAVDYAIETPPAYDLIMKFCPKAKPTKKKVPASDKKQSKKVHANGIANEQFNNDADKYFEEVLEKKPAGLMEIDEEEKDKKEVQVDSVSKLEKTCEVVKDDLYYDILLIKIDVKRQFYGVSNFYVMQILFDRVKNIYILWTRWGRIGNEGQYQRTPFNSKADCEKEFKKVFRQKTGGKWEEVESFVPVKGKYKIKRLGGKVIYQEKDGLHWKYSDRQVNLKDFLVDLDLVKQVKSKLSESQLAFMKTLVNQANIVRKASAKQVNKDIFIQGLLDKDVLEKVKKLFEQLLELTKKKEEAASKRDYSQFQFYEELMFDISNEYYELIFPIDFACSKMLLLDNENIVKVQTEKLSIVYEFEQVTKLLFAALHNIKEVNPYDYIFNSMPVKLHQLDEADAEFQLLLRYVNNFSYTHTWNKQSKNTYLKQIFKVSDGQTSAQAEETFNGLHNHFMLFHGTSNANVLSIIQQGLRITPKNSSKYTGSAFGEGIYFADLFSLAAGYADQGEYCVLACEVALGNVCNQVTNEAMDEGVKNYDSLRMMGRQGPNFENNLMRDDGVIWPIGKQVDYEAPVIMEDEKEFPVFNDMKRHYQQKEEEKKGKAQAKGKKGKQVPAKKKGGRKGQKEEEKDSQSEESDDEVMQIDTSSKNKRGNIKGGKQNKKANESERGSSNDEDESEEEVEEELVEVIEDANEKEYQAKIDPHSKNYKIDPHVINHVMFTNITKSNTFYYQLIQSQYVVFNPDQVRVRYVLHFKEDPAPVAEDSGEESDLEEEAEF